MIISLTTLDRLLRLGEVVLGDVNLRPALCVVCRRSWQPRRLRALWIGRRPIKASGYICRGCCPAGLLKQVRDVWFSVS